MKYNINNWKIELSLDGQVKILEYDNHSLLHNGKEHWFKTFPIIWPQTSESTGFTYKEQDYKVPRHGFWKDLAWEIVRENDTISLFTQSLANDKYPFSFDIHYKIIPLDTKIKFEVSFTNISKVNAYFQFGFHPAFKTDASSKINIKKEPQLILGNGKLAKSYLNSNVLNEMDFGQSFDTLFYQNVQNQKISLVNKDYSLVFTYNTKHLQVWRPQNANFICIEPWNNLNDKMYKAPNEVEKKKEITLLKPFESKSFWVEVEYLKI